MQAEAPFSIGYKQLCISVKLPLHDDDVRLDVGRNYSKAESLCLQLCTGEKAAYLLDMLPPANFKPIGSKAWSSPVSGVVLWRLPT
jgi:hypothetical protein